MSSYFLCGTCDKELSSRPNLHDLRESKVDCADGHTHLRLMIDHGHANGRKPYDDPLAVCPDYVERTCTYEVVPNVVRGNISLDCFGRRCSRCGHTQIGLDRPGYCPKCHARVIGKGEYDR